MTWGDLITLSPLLALVVAIVAVMLAAAFARSHLLALVLSLAGLAAAFGLLFAAAARGRPQVTPLLSLDDFALFVIGLLLVATAAVALLSWSYLGRFRVHPEEYYALLLAATLGAATLAAATHFISFVLGLEVLSVALYVLIGYLAGDERSVEAAVKYLVLAGATSGFLLFGMGLVYVMTGQMGVAGVAEALGAQDGLDVIVVLGAAMLFVGVGFKLAVVPFHMWTPDVYEGAPTPVAAYIATVSKGAVVAVIVRFLRPVSLDEGSALFLALAVVAAASMIGGNVLALRQDNVKRILAYSSIAHLGYILVAFLATDGNAVTAVVFYLVAYTATNLVAFGVVSELSTRDHEAERLADYDGLARRRPVAAATMAVALFSLAGIPLTAGFLAKVYLLTAGTGSALWALVVILVLSSTIGLYYYTRIIVAMYVREPAGAAAPRAARPAAVVLVAFSLVVLVLGVYPGPLLDVIQAAASTLP